MRGTVVQVLGLSYVHYPALVLLLCMWTDRAARALCFPFLPVVYVISSTRLTELNNL